MVKRMRVLNKKNGGAVSLYLPAEARHLHDLAVADEDLKPSKIYADALRAILGDHEERHPLELIQETQAEEIQALENQLKVAKQRFEETSNRLPNEIAKSFYEKYRLSKAEKAELKQLWKLLFYSSSSPRDKITVNLDSESCLNRYRLLLFRQLETRDGIKIGATLDVQEHLHSSYDDGGTALCVNHEMNECRSIKKQAGIKVAVDSPFGVNFCDDLVYRCDSCWEARKKEEKQFWEQEKTPAGALVETNVGLLKAESDVRYEEHKKIIIANSQADWQAQNPDKANRLDELISLRFQRPVYKDAVLQPQFAGSMNWPPTRRRYDILSHMKVHDPDEYENFQKCVAELAELNADQANHIKGRLIEWENNGTPSVLLDNGVDLSKAGTEQQGASGFITFINSEKVNALRFDRDYFTRP